MPPRCYADKPKTVLRDQRICFSGDNRAQQLKRSIRPDKNSMDGVWVSQVSQAQRHLLDQVLLSRFAASNAVFSPFAYFLIDRIGRRALLLTSLLSMLPFLILTGHFLDNKNTHAAVAFIIIYTALYSPGAGVSWD